MVYIIASLLRKSFKKVDKLKEAKDLADIWKATMLTPINYSKIALTD